METLRLRDVSADAAARSAAEVLRAGGVVLYPTDTLYGLGADALSDEAVAKVRAIKGRADEKPIHCIIRDVAMAEQYAEVNDAAHTLAKKFWPGPLTLILSTKGGSASGGKKSKSGVLRNMNTIGVRIPNNDFCIALAREFGKPYTTTSANVSGKDSPRTVGGILEQLGLPAQAGGGATVDLIVDAGELPERQASTVVDVSSGKPRVLREGALSEEDIHSL